MGENKFIVASASVLLLSSVVFLGYTINSSKALSYLSKDPVACINCHVMNTQFATWQHSSHKDVTCVECHLPTDGFFNKYAAKARDGWNHSVAFTFNTFDNTIRITDDAAGRIQKNCKSCHLSLASQLVSNFDLNHNFKAESTDNERRCWSCHKSVPHGKVRGLSTTPYNLGIKKI